MLKILNHDYPFPIIIKTIVSIIWEGTTLTGWYPIFNESNIRLINEYLAVYMVIFDVSERLICAAQVLNSNHLNLKSLMGKWIGLKHLWTSSSDCVTRPEVTPLWLYLCWTLWCRCLPDGAQPGGTSPSSGTRGGTWSGTAFGSTQ